MTVTHPDYAILAARIAVSNLHKQTKKQFSQVMTDLYEWINPKNGKKSPMIADDVYKVIMDNAEELNSAIVYDSVSSCSSSSGFEQATRTRLSSSTVVTPW